ncbi:MAG: hypothetical protein ACKOVA_11825 [Novosphingobium sp.]
MAKAEISRRTSTRPHAGRADQRLPHPSWRLVPAAGPADQAARVVDAADFWQRLGY